MTSGAFHSLCIGAIRVDREGRQRKHLNGIEILADSIKRLGLIHPIVVTRDLTLVAGERRLAACKQLGWGNITCQYTDELDDLSLRAIELEENIKRTELTWQELIFAVADYHEAQCSIEPDWNQTKTGEALGMSQNTVSDYLKVVKHARANPKVLHPPQYSTAKGIVQRQESRADPAATLSLKELKAAVSKEDPIKVADFNEWAKTYDGPKFNFIHCDFPFGINADRMHQGGSVATHGGYDDSEDIYWRLLGTLCRNLNRFCADSAHIVFWFSMHHYCRTLNFFARNSDFVIDPFPLVWLKSDNVGLLPDPHRGPRRIYETALFGSRGDRKIVAAVSNAFAAPTDRSTHMSTKPEAVLRHFLRMFVDENSLVFDPTCGSGTALVAAEACGASHIFGLEINPEFAERANYALQAQRNHRAYE